MSWLVFGVNIANSSALDEWTIWTMMVKSRVELDALDAEYAAHRAQEMDHYRKLRKLQIEDPNEVSSPLVGMPKYGGPGFYHGVASGSPMTSSVVLWTRYSPYFDEQESTLNSKMPKIMAFWIRWRHNWTHPQIRHCAAA